MFRKSPLYLAPVALLSFLAVGCSEMPTQPVVDASSSNGNGVNLQAPGAQPMESSASLKIHGGQGGSVSAGIFTVVVNPGCYDGNATVTVSQPDPNVPVAVLSISPASKNNFYKPVTLIANLPGLDNPTLMASRVSELNPSSGGWSPVLGGQSDSQAMTVSAGLMHFSTYRVDIAVPGSNGGSGTDTRTAKDKLAD